MTPLTIRGCITIALLALSACGPPTAAPIQDPPSNSLFAAEPEQQWRLPDRLREISGLAAGADGRLFGHDDEQAVIYQIDAARGVLVKAFALGDPIERGDFEGLAITPDGEFWMTTSAGRLFRFHEGADGAHIRFDTHDLDLADVCEIEGLAYLAAERSLILACKHNQAREMSGAIQLLAWPIGGDATRPWLRLSEAGLAQAASVRRFRPSSLDIDARGNRLLLLSAFDGALAELSLDGEILSARRLNPTHVQAEGVAVLGDGGVVIADEGVQGQPLLSRYGPAS